MADSQPLLTTVDYVDAHSSGAAAWQQSELSMEQGRESPPIPLVAEPKPVGTAPFWGNTEEWWATWIGLSCFGLTIALTAGHVDVALVGIWSNGKELRHSFGGSWIGRDIVFVAATFCILFVVHKCMKRGKTFPWLQYLWLCGIAFVCYIIGSYKPLHDAGLSTSVWCILIGMLITNCFPSMYAQYKDSKAYSLEFFIKISIVLLAINLTEIYHSGGKGILVAWVDTCILITALHLFGYKVLKMRYEEAMITSCGVSICGSSAAIAVASVFDPPGGDSASKKATKFANSLIAVMSLLTIPLIPVMPMISKHFNFSDDLAGAWIGGSVDSTGGVTACASLGGIDVLHAAVIIKMLQNILIGPVVLFITWISPHSYGKTSVGLLWEKFPKFVLGFLVTACLTTALPKSLQNRVITNSFVVSEWFAALSFVLIGMDINLRPAISAVFNAVAGKRSADGADPESVPTTSDGDINGDDAAQSSSYSSMVILYCLGQVVDIFSTLGFAYAVFK